MANKINSIVAEAVATVQTRKFWKDYTIMTLGMLVAAIAVNYFLIPANLIIGSTSGIAIVVSQLLAGIGLPVKMSICLTVINTALLLLSFIFLGRDFGGKTVYASVIIGPMVDLCEWVYPYANLLTEAGQTSVMDNVALDSVCFVLLLSASQSILFSINGSTGGLDIVAKMMNKFLSMEMGTAVTVAGLLASATAIAINPFRVVVIGLIATWINGVVVDYFLAGLSRRKRVCIITDTPEPVLNFLLYDIRRGCSMYDMHGGYTGEHHTELQTYLHKSDLAKLMEFIRVNNIKVFITASNVNVSFHGDSHEPK